MYISASGHWTKYVLVLHIALSLFNRRRSYLNFHFDEGTGTCTLGHALNMRQANETADSDVYGVKIGELIWFPNSA